MWNRLWQPDQPPPPPEDDDLTKVRKLLDATGLFRLRVISPRLKVLLSLIAQSGEPYLIRRGNNGVPLDSDVTMLKDNLESLQRVLEAYVIIQQDRSDGDRDENLEKGFDAVEGLASMILGDKTAGGNLHLTGFRVDTQILSAQRFR